MKDLIQHENIHNDSSIHWLTPPDILSKLGEFDFDPCAAPEPRPWHTAKTMIALPQDGLKEEWQGRVWLNPPYGNTKIFSDFMEKMSEHKNGIALVFARTDAKWFINTVFPAAVSFIFVTPRLSFYGPNGIKYPNKAGAPSVLIAYSDFDDQILKNSGVKGCYLKKE